LGNLLSLPYEHWLVPSYRHDHAQNLLIFRKPNGVR
jgi:hypothetical protein